MVLYFMVLVSIASAPKLGLNLLEMSSRIGRQRVPQGKLNNRKVVELFLYMTPKLPDLSNS